MNKNLELLKKSNPTIEIEENGDHYKISRPWNDDSINFLFDKKKKLIQLKDLVFPEELVAIFHKENQLLEFIFAPVPKGEYNLNDVQIFNWKGLSFECYFSKVTKPLELLATNFVESEAESESYYRNLPMFKEYFNKSPMYERFFKNAIPISFFVKGNFRKISNDFVALSKTINFYRFYFQRRAPQIILLKKKIEKQKYKRPCLSMKDKFPNVINAKEIDPTILEIFSVARSTRDIRLKFIFYYQILEFVSYYYLNTKVHNNLSSILRRPEVSANASEFSKRIIEEMKDYFSLRDDSSKMDSTITDYCEIDDIKLEIESNYEYFCKDIVFDGGLFIPKILKNKDGIECLTDGDLIKIKKNIEKIRNVLVHLRESRENKVILPTENNNNLLVPYLYIVKRLAEKVAIQFD